ncbi:hypothetical protein B0H15DRAFT_542544 [Mycena belliarum]|uniref:Uncharacterized protein n=1 Tax=Mycena belliarum TaxID=1033014 RepID=A0AAD6XS18_9AGAR|nr:hypothetical protein B0H15DRAFT_542544 [Mycena belliae]
MPSRGGAACDVRPRRGRRGQPPAAAGSGRLRAYQVEMSATPAPTIAGRWRGSRDLRQDDVGATRELGRTGGGSHERGQRLAGAQPPEVVCGEAQRGRGGDGNGEDEAPRRRGCGGGAGGPDVGAGRGDGVLVECDSGAHGCGGRGGDERGRGTVGA